MRQSGTGDGGVSTSIPSSLQMVHRYMIHVAAKVERLHERTSVAKTAYLRRHRARGGSTADDPFERAAREEMLVNVAKEDIAAAEMVASRRPQLSTGQDNPQQQQPTATPAPTLAASSPAPLQTGSLFGNTGGGGATSGGGLFGSAALPTPTPSGGGGSLFAGLGASTAPAPFSLSTPAPATTTPAFGASTNSLFSPTSSPAGAIQPASPAPASPGLFGGLTTPAPTLGQPAFGSAFGAPAPVAGSKTRSKRSTRK